MLHTQQNTELPALNVHRDLLLWFLFDWPCFICWYRAQIWDQQMLTNMKLSRTWNPQRQVKVLVRKTIEKQYVRQNHFSLPMQIKSLRADNRSRYTDCLVTGINYIPPLCCHERNRPSQGTMQHIIVTPIVFHKCHYFEAGSFNVTHRSVRQYTIWNPFDLLITWLLKE